MKIFTKVVQGLVALYTITGAAYMMGNYEFLATPQALATLPSYFWTALGIIQIILAVTLISALFLKRVQSKVFNSAVCLAGLSLLGSVIYIAYAGFPGVLWSVIPAALYAFIAYQNKFLLGK